MLSNTSVRSNFFDRILTARHLLTRRTITIAGGGFVALLAPVLWLSSDLAWFQKSGLVETPAVGASDPRPLRVSTALVGQAGPSFMTQQFTGMVKPRRSSMLAAKSIGRVEEIFVEMGESVAAGQLLIQLDRATLDAERNTVSARLASAQAQLDELRQGPRQQDIDQAAERVAEIESTLQLNNANLRRTESLVRSASVSRQELDEATYTVEATQAKLAAARHALDLLREGTRVEQVEAAEANVRGLQAELELIAVRIEEQAIVAPYDGKIQTRLVDEGVVVSPGQALLQIVESGTVEVHVGLPPELAQDLSMTSLSVTIAERRVPVELARLSPAINEATRTREVVLNVLSSSTAEILLGNSVNVEVQTPVVRVSESTSGYWIPRDALTAASRGLWAVYIAVPVQGPEMANNSSTLPSHKIERRQVELLRSQGEWTEVRGPIAANELLVVEGSHRVTQGQFVATDIR